VAVTEESLNYFKESASRGEMKGNAGCACKVEVQTAKVLHDLPRDGRKIYHGASTCILQKDQPDMGGALHSRAGWKDSTLDQAT
jgi:hypothetical protein